MLTPAEVLKEELEDLKQDLIDNHLKLGMKASGKWINELATEVVEVGSKLIGSVTGAHYTTQLVRGCRPGKMPPIATIERWINQKGIRAINRKMKARQLAFAIAKKIAQVGTRYHQQGGTDLIEKVITPARLQLIIERVGEAVLEEQIEVSLTHLKTLERAA